MPAPEAMTYTSLQRDVELYTERSDQEFISQLPRFVMLAEQRLALEAKGLGFVRIAEFTMQPSEPVYTKPARWRQTKYLRYVATDGSVVFLKPRKYDYCLTYASGEPAGAPKYYADLDYTHWFFAVTPSAAWLAEVSYYERPEPLSDAVQTNWTTRNAPQLLLYATLLEAQPYLKNTTNLALWQAQYAEIISSILKEEIGFNSDETGAS